MFLAVIRHAVSFTNLSAAFCSGPKLSGPVYLPVSLKNAALGSSQLNSVAKLCNPGSRLCPASSTFPPHQLSSLSNFPSPVYPSGGCGCAEEEEFHVKLQIKIVSSFFQAITYSCLKMCVSCSTDPFAIGSVVADLLYFFSLPELCRIKGTKSVRHQLYM